MWYLEAFDKKSEQLVREWQLRGLDEAVLRPLVDIDDDYEGPLAPYDFQLKDTASVHVLAQYADELIEADEACDYFVGYSAEPGEEGILVNGLHPPPRALPQVFKDFQRVEGRPLASEEDSAGSREIGP
jgi:hypothetical protein